MVIGIFLVNRLSEMVMWELLEKLVELARNNPQLQTSETVGSTIIYLAQRSGVRHIINTTFSSKKYSSKVKIMENENETLSQKI
jgi:hypothetical protein